AQTHRLCRLDERLLVESREGLQRRVRADAAGAGGFGRRGVEGDQRRKRQGAFPERVHATAIAVLTRALRPRQSPIDRVPDARGIGGSTLGPPILRFSSPPAESAMSSTISASTRNRGPRASSRL